MDFNAFKELAKKGINSLHRNSTVTFRLFVLLICIVYSNVIADNHVFVTKGRSYNVARILLGLFVTLFFPYISTHYRITLVHPAKDPFV